MGYYTSWTHSSLSYYWSLLFGHTHVHESSILFYTINYNIEWVTILIKQTVYFVRGLVDCPFTRIFFWGHPVRMTFQQRRH